MAADSRLPGERLCDQIMSAAGDRFFGFLGIVRLQAGVGVWLVAGSGNPKKKGTI